jgi:gas vesicle structural protein
MMQTDEELTLLELTDRLLNRGVVLAGEALISVGGVDLIYLGLNVVLTSVENLRTRRESAAPRDHHSADR